jgi:hypothetical protein
MKKKKIEFLKEHLSSLGVHDFQMEQALSDFIAEERQNKIEENKNARN